MNTINYGSNYYYHITSLDSTTPFTNESWYSTNVTVSAQYPGPFYVSTIGQDLWPGTKTQPFATIQKAANTMAPGVTFATTYIDPGTYAQKVVIRSNKNNGYMVFTKASNTIPVLFGSSKTNFAFKITNTSSVLISKMQITYFSNGFNLLGNISNVIIQQNILTNYSTGIYTHGNNINHITLYSNSCYMIGNTTGLFVDANGLNKSLLRNNYFYNFNYAIDYWGGGYSNRIIANRTFNGWEGLYVPGSGFTNNLILSNYFNHGTTGIDISPSYKNYFGYNKLIGNLDEGILVEGSAWSNKFVHNIISSNGFAGIHFYNGFSYANTFTSNHISGPAQPYGIWMSNANRNLFMSNTFTLNTNGIYITGAATNNIFYNNIINANKNFGISFNSKLMINNVIKSNTISGPNQNYGIYFNGANGPVNHNFITNNTIFGQAYGINFTNASRNYIEKNNIYKNTNFGIYLQSKAQTNLIQANQIYSNTVIGIFFNNSANHNAVTSNNIFGPNQKYGVYINNANYESNYGNNIYNNTNGIYIVNSSNSLITRNKIQSGLKGTGIYYNISSSLIQLNTITNNLYGIRYANGTLQMTKNNIFDNATNFLNMGSPFAKITNNWWNSTIASTNARRIINNGGYSNFMPYRIFGAFDITQGADTTPLPVITWMTSLPSVTTATLRWNKPSNPANFARYFIFRSQTPGVTNLSAATWGTNNVNGTNYIDTPPFAGTWYYHVTSLDTPNPYTILTNESWYSYPITGAVATVGSYSIIATNTNLSYSGLAFNFQTTSNVIWITNNGTLPCQVLGQVNDFTNLPGPYVWKVTNGATAINQMQVRYSVFTNGVQSAWTLVPNMATTVTLTPSLPLFKKMYLYIEIVTPTASSSVGPYKSRFRVVAHQ